MPPDEPLYLAYHDEEWGVPVHDDRKLFEMLILEGAQAGLSWITILRRREAYRQAFDGFDPERIAAYGPDRVAALLADAGIIRNRAKVEATIANARAFLRLQGEPGGFVRLPLGLRGRRAAARTASRSAADVPAETPESKAMSKELRKRGFSFVGPDHLLRLHAGGRHGQRPPRWAASGIASCKKDDRVLNLVRHSAKGTLALHERQEGTEMAHARLLAKIYRDVPAADLEAFQRFRAENPPRTAEIAGRTWTYLSGGTGGRTLLFLPGAQGIGEAVWGNITHFAPRFRWIAPSYPPVPTMTELAGGIAALLDREGIARVAIISGSYGGFVAQVFVRRHPDRVERLVLSHTGPPTPGRGQVIEKSLRWLPRLPMFLLRLQYRKVMAGLIPKRPETALTLAQLEEVIALHLTKESMINGYRRVVDYDREHRFAPGDLDGWPGRVLLLMGDNDPATPEPVRERMKALYPGAEVRVFAGTGHATGILKRDEYLAAMEAFLAEPSPPSP